MTSAMPKSRLLPLLALLPLAAACAPPPSAPRSASLAAGHRAAAVPAEAIYAHGVVWTGVPGALPAEALAVGGGRLLAVGSAAEVERYRGAATRTVDLGGRFVVPGLIDAHTHFLSGGFELAGVDLRGARNPAELTRRLADFVARQPRGRWVTGGDWDHEAWGGELPRRDWIDAATRYTPVLVERLDGHMALATSKALALAGVTRATADPPGGTIVRDARTGEPTGILKDAAMDLVARVIPPPTDGERDQALARATAHAVARGVTEVQDMGTWDDLATYRRAAERGALGLRVYAFVPIATWARLADFVREHGRGDDLLRWGGVKGFVDGSLGSTTAWFYAPYADQPKSRGLTVTDLSDLGEWIRAADAAGLQVAVHAIGDRANDWLLDRFAAVARAGGRRDRRFRIEHAQHLTRVAIARLGRGEAIASMQPYHAIDDGRWAEKRIGAARVRTSYAWRSLADAGARLAFGSDWTVAPIDPLLGIYAAVTRATLDGKHPGGWVPEQQVGVEEALRAYTAGSAYAGFQESRLGTLAPGKLADFVVLSADLLTIPPARIRDVRVLRTVIGGRDRYAAPVP
jgi:predicted amidohydrolase YtcJ